MDPNAVWDGVIWFSFDAVSSSGVLRSETKPKYNSCFITSAEEGGYVYGSVCLSVCLSICPSDYSQTCERILTKFLEG